MIDNIFIGRIAPVELLEHLEVWLAQPNMRYATYATTRGWSDIGSLPIASALKFTVVGPNIRLCNCGMEIPLGLAPNALC